MEEISTKSELRSKIKDCYSFKIEFECGLKFYHCKAEILRHQEVLYIREHDYKFIWREYNFEQFVNAVWSKIKRDGIISTLIIK